MNIFWTDESVIDCAKHLDDVRARKMIVEHCQMLSTAIYYHNPEQRKQLGLYKPCYQNHPCTKWVRDLNYNNAKLLCIYTSELLNRYPNHKTNRVFNNLLPYIMSTSTLEATKPPRCNPYKHTTWSTIDTYRQTMRDKWDNDIRTPTWKTGTEPEWR